MAAGGGATRSIERVDRGRLRRDVPLRRNRLDPSGAERPRILLADDNADMRDYVSRLLSERYDVTAVPDGMAALAAARRRPPDLVITDVMMPVVDGFGVLRAIRDDPATASVPVILLSARAGRNPTSRGSRPAPTIISSSPSVPESCSRGSRPTWSWRGSVASPPRASGNSAPRPKTSSRASPTDSWRSIATGGSPTSTPRPSGSIAVKREEMLGRVYWELFPTYVGTKHEEEFQRAVLEHVSVQFESHYEPWSCWFEVKAYPSKDGGLAVYFRDITERKHGLMMERLLAEASATFASSLDFKTNLKRVAGLVVPTLADVCVFDVVSRDGTLQRAGWAHAIPAETSLLDDIDRFVPGRVLQESSHHPGDGDGRDRVDLRGKR